MFEGSDTSSDIGIDWCCKRIVTVLSYLFARFWPLLRTSMLFSLGLRWSDTPSKDDPPLRVYCTIFIFHRSHTDAAASKLETSLSTALALIKPNLLHEIGTDIKNSKPAGECADAHTGYSRSRGSRSLSCWTDAP